MLIAKETDDSVLDQATEGTRRVRSTYNSTWEQKLNSVAQPYPAVLDNPAERQINGTTAHKNSSFCWSTHPYTD